MKRMRIVLAALLLAIALPASAYAEHLSGGDWAVTCDASGKVTDNFSSGEFADKVSDLQPGDDITLSVKLKHENEKAGDWYMANEVLKALEDGEAAGGAYGYKLVYQPPSGASRTLYDSDSVGGDSAAGLKEATGALSDFFYLDELESGQTAEVQLTVSLDGETEGNAYFDTLAQLSMKFAVQLDGASPATTATDDTAEQPRPTTPADRSSEPSDRTPVKTGDATNLFPYFIAMAASGAVLLALALYGLRLRRNDREEGVR